MILSGFESRLLIYINNANGVMDNEIKTNTRIDSKSIIRSPCIKAKTL